MSAKITRTICLLVYLAVCGLPAMGPVAAENSAAEPGQSLPVQAAGIKLEQSYGHMPLVFIPNRGRMDERVHFAVKGKDKSIYFTSEGLTYVLSEAPPKDDGIGRLKSPRSLRSLEPEERLTDEARRHWVVKLDFVGSRKDVRPESLEESETVISYFKGKPEDWQAGIQASSRIIYRDLWPGIDLVYYGTVNRMKYDFLVQPGADPGQIKLAYRGADTVMLNEQGQLEISTPLGAFADDVPVAWQDGDNGPMDVSVAYALHEAAVSEAELDEITGNAHDRTGVNLHNRTHVYGFEVGSYDLSLPLVLDPAVLVYCGYIGGWGSDTAHAIAVDSAGNAYVAGRTNSTQASFPVHAGPDLTHNGDYDAFVAKVNAAGTALIYCGYIGGGGDDRAFGIAVDSAGNAYVAGETNSTQTSFPVTVGPDLTHNGGYDAFVAKVNASGTALVYCGYIGGSGDDKAFGIAVDSAGNAYVAGWTESNETSFPVLGGPDLYYKGNGDAFVTKVNAAGTALVYCGYIGGLFMDYALAIAVDGAGNAYVAGVTNSSETHDFPVIGGPGLNYKGNGDAFVAKVNAAGTALVYCGYIGGSSDDAAWGIAVDGSGNAYVAGITESTQASFPVVVGPDLTYNGGWDAFVAKVNAAGTALVYCGYIGGSSWDHAFAIAVDGAGNAYVAGGTSSEHNFPAIGGPDLTYNGGADAFVTKVNPGGTAFVYCGYIGGSGNEWAYGIAVDGAGNAYVAGLTNSTEAGFPVIGGPDLIHNGGNDAFLAKVSESRKADLLGTWDGQGVYYRNSETGAWVKLATPATLIDAGDIDGDGTDDLIGIWPGQGGVWTRYSSTGDWALLSSTAVDIASGDMNGDGRSDLLGTWDGQGVYYRNSVTGAWVLMATPATLVTAGDLDGDGIDDLIGIWPGQGGVWTRYSSTGAWALLSSTARHISAGDMNGNGRVDLVGTWDGQGVYYRNSITGAWVKMASPATLITTGDLDSDGIDDLIGIWPGQGGVWVKYSSTGAWALLSSTARDIAAGKMRAGGAGDAISALRHELQGPFGGIADGPSRLSGEEDHSAEGPGGIRFLWQEERNLVPNAPSSLERIPGPGEPGFRFIEQPNLFPGSVILEEPYRKKRE